jgi:hypothetical protein
MESNAPELWVHHDPATVLCQGNTGTSAVPVDPDAGQVECKNCGLLLVRNTEETPDQAAKKLLSQLLRKQPWAERAQLMEDAPDEILARLPMHIENRKNNLDQLRHLFHAVAPDMMPPF